jgi:hypothetical protein
MDWPRRGGRHPFSLGTRPVRRHAAWVGTALFLYLVLVFSVALVMPYVVPAVTLASSMPLEERARAAERFLALGEAFWPICGTLLVGCLMLSVHLSRRIAGPIVRLERFASGLIQGDLAARIRLREGDELRVFGELLCRAVVNLDAMAQTLCEREARAREAVATALEAARAAAPADPVLLDALEAASKHLEEAAAETERLRLSQPAGTPR